MAHDALALKIAQKSLVLLKNEGEVLPLDIDTGNIDAGKKINVAVLGDETTVAGHGSGGVQMPFTSLISEQADQILHKDLCC